MANDLTLLIPRKDLSEPRWNQIDEFARSHSPKAKRVVGRDPWFPPRPFWSMSRAINDARTRAKTSKLLITPCDYIHYPDVLEQISDVLDREPWWQPYGGLVHLRQFDAAKHLGSNMPVPRDIDGKRTSLGLSVIAVRTDVFDDVAGMDPFFEGFAPEDYAFHIILNALHGAPPPPQEQWLIELDSPRVKTNFGTALNYCEDQYYTHIADIPDVSNDPTQRILRPRPTKDGRKAIREGVERRRGMTLAERNAMDELYPPNSRYRPNASAQQRDYDRRLALLMERRARRAG